MLNVADCEWLAENSLQLSAQYPGKWIAVHDGKVIGVGDTMADADQQAAERRPERDYILEQMNVEPDLPHVD